MLAVNRDNFEQEVLNSDVPVLVDFFADWCGPCKMLMPVVEQISNEVDNFKVCKLNIDEDAELAVRYGVMSVPTLIAFKDGEILNVSIGVKSKGAILGMFD